MRYSYKDGKDNVAYVALRARHDVRAASLLIGLLALLALYRFALHFGCAQVFQWRSQGSGGPIATFDVSLPEFRLESGEGEL
jgi:hypothetical protein